LHLPSVEAVAWQPEGRRRAQSGQGKVISKGKVGANGKSSSAVGTGHNLNVAGRKGRKLAGNELAVNVAANSRYY
jgi:hypothetical protein